MTYQEAIDKSLTVKWKVGTCGQGTQCWCRTITCDPPLMYDDGDEQYPFFVVSTGEVMAEIVEHIVELHNKNYGK